MRVIIVERRERERERERGKERGKIMIIRILYR
jgi:hypothetical protein